MFSGGECGAISVDVGRTTWIGLIILYHNRTFQYLPERSHLVTTHFSRAKCVRHHGRVWGLRCDIYKCTVRFWLLPAGSLFLWTSVPLFPRHSLQKNPKGYQNRGSPTQTAGALRPSLQTHGDQSTWKCSGCAYEKSIPADFGRKVTFGFGTGKWDSDLPLACLKI